METRKKKPRVLVWLRRMFFGPAKELSFLEEEQVQSPMRSIAKRFLSNKIAMTGVVVFVLVLLLVLIGPAFYPLDLSYSDGTQQNVPPSSDMAKIPDAMKGKIQDLAVGPTFSVGCDTDGNVYSWGYTRITGTIDISKIPEAVKKEQIVKVAAGFDHAVGLSKKGVLYVWGNTRLGQGNIPEKAMREADFVQIEASFQFSAALTDRGYLYLWGNEGATDCKIKKEFQNHIKKVALSDYAYVSLMDDGSVKYTGFNVSSPYAKIPEALSEGVVDIAASANTFAAVKNDGSVYIWGNVTRGENQIPEYEGEIVKL